MRDAGHQNISQYTWTREHGLDRLAAGYLKELNKLVEQNRGRIVKLLHLDTRHGWSGHDEVTLSRGWRVLRVIPVTRDAKTVLKGLSDNVPGYLSTLPASNRARDALVGGQSWYEDADRMLE